jgi:hypothetical protein
MVETTITRVNFYDYLNGHETAFAGDDGWGLAKAHWDSLNEEDDQIVGELCVLLELQPVDLVFTGLRKGNQIQGIRAIGTELLKYFPQHSDDVDLSERADWGPFSKVNRSMCRKLAIMHVHFNVEGRFRERFVRLFGEDMQEVDENCLGFQKLKKKPNGDDAVKIRKQLFESARAFYDIWSLA